MKHLILFALLIASSVAFADPAAQDDELTQLQAKLAKVEQEQQAAFRNYQMTKEALSAEVQQRDRAAIQQPYGLAVDAYDMPIDTPPPNFDEVIRAHKEREQRIQQQMEELKTLSQQYQDLESQRKALRAQIEKLAPPSN